jgi:hypothetical protein
LIPHGLGRRALVLAVSAIVVFTLCGCTAKPHVSARLVNGTPAFAVCESIRSNKIVVEVKRPTASDPKYKSVWLADGGSHVQANDIISFGKPPSGFKTSVLVDSVDFKKQQIYFGVDYVGADGSLKSSEHGVFDGRDLSESSWLNWDGNHTSQPC